MIFDICRKLLHRLFHKFLNRIYYPDVSLMEQIMIHIILRASGFGQHSGNIPACSLDRKLEYILTLHLQRDVIFFLCDVWSRLKLSVLPEFVGSAGCRQLYASDIVSRGKYCSSGAITEKHTGPSGSSAHTTSTFFTLPER